MKQCHGLTSGPDALISYPYPSTQQSVETITLTMIRTTLVTMINNFPPTWPIHWEARSLSISSPEFPDMDHPLKINPYFFSPDSYLCLIGLWCRQTKGPLSPITRTLSYKISHRVAGESHRKKTEYYVKVSFPSTQEGGVNSLPCIDVRNIQTCRAFLWAYLNQTDDNCQETKSQWIEKMLRRMAVLQFILYTQNQRRRRKKGYMKSTGVRLRGQEIAKRGISGLNTKWSEETLLLHWWVENS